MVKALRLIIKKEEQLILLDGATDCASKHIPTELVFWQTSEIVLPTIGIQNVVAEELPDIAVELVGSGLEGSANDSSLEIAEFSGRILRDEVEFLNSIGRGRVSQEVVRNLVIVQSVE